LAVGAGIVALLWEPIMLALFIIGDFSRHQKTPDEIRHDFILQRAAYESLRQMAKEDVNAAYFEVGTDKIQDFWRHGRTWSRSNDWQEKLSLDEVLQRTALTKERYNRYLELLARAKG